MTDAAQDLLALRRDEDVGAARIGLRGDFRPFCWRGAVRLSDELLRD